MRNLKFFLLVALLIAWTLEADENTPKPSKKRFISGKVAPLEYKGIRYSPMRWGKARGLEQNGGYFIAVDIKTGKELWLKKVYTVLYSSDKEADKQDVFITSFEMSGENEITITNEKDESFVFNINSHKVIKKKPWYSFFD